MSDAQVPQIPDLKIAQNVFLLQSGPADAADGAKDALMAAIRAGEMAPFYTHVCEKLGWMQDDALRDKLAAANAAEAATLDARLQDAEANLGETEISDALAAKAEFLTRIGDKDGALAAWQAAFDKTAPMGTRIDMVLSQVRIGFFFFDGELTARHIERARELIDKGGDWDRRNRLRVYEGIYKLSVRDFGGATPLLLSALATFTCSELMSYKDFVRYAVLAGMIALDRPELKKKVVNAPEILEVIHLLPSLEPFVNALYECRYDAFFQALAAVEGQLRADWVLFAHYRYYVREMRIIAYSQLLESYRSVTLASMAASFGVTEAFVDADLSKFIAAQRLNAVIDKVGGVIETNRPDAKNAQYQACIKQGDLLLTRVQKLGRVINV